MKTTEKFDLAYYQQKIRETNGENGDKTFAEYIENDGMQVKISLNENEISLFKIEPLSFNAECIFYHKNGILKEKGKRFFCSGIKIGIWREYDERGNLVKETDEDKKFEKLYLKPENILRWLEREGYIDRQTGKGQEKFVGDLQNEPNIDINFWESENNGLFSKRIPAGWSIIITEHGIRTTHAFDAETGLYGKTTQILEE